MNFCCRFLLDAPTKRNHINEVKRITLTDDEWRLSDKINLMKHIHILNMRFTIDLQC